MLNDGTLKRDIIIQVIKSYKNRQEWTDEYVEEKYKSAIDYMIDNFDKIYDNVQNGSISSIKQGERSITYNNKNVIESDFILMSMLGKPLLRGY